MNPNVLSHAHKRRKVFFVSILWCAIVIVAIGLTEIGLQMHRAWLIRTDEDWSGWTHINRKSEDPVLVYEMTPGASAISKKVEVTINRDGYRDDEFPSPFPETARRIVVLGDSVAYGWGVPMDKAFPQLLEAKLNQDRAEGSPATVVYNLAVAGYSTRQEVRLLETRAARFKPELVIIHYVLNDPDTYDGGLSRYFTEPKSELLRRAQIAYFRIKRQMDNSKLADKRKEDYAFFVHGLYSGQIAQDFRRIGEIRRERGVPILVAINPMLLFEAGKPYGWKKIHEDIAALCDKNDLEFLDLYDAAFKDRDSDGLSFDGYHPNAEGHALIADALFEFLRANPDLNALGRGTREQGQ